MGIIRLEFLSIELIDWSVPVSSGINLSTVSECDWFLPLDHLLVFHL